MKIQHVVVAAIIGTIIVFYNQISSIPIIQWISTDWHWLTTPIIIMSALTIIGSVAEAFRNDR
jgi:hypothetical protein